MACGTVIWPSIIAPTRRKLPSSVVVQGCCRGSRKIHVEHGADCSTVTRAEARVLDTEIADQVLIENAEPEGMEQVAGWQEVGEEVIVFGPRAAHGWCSADFVGGYDARQAVNGLQRIAKRSRHIEQLFGLNRRLARRTFAYALAGDDDHFKRVVMRSGVRCFCSRSRTMRLAAPTPVIRRRVIQSPTHPDATYAVA